VPKPEFLSLRAQARQLEAQLAEEDRLRGHLDDINKKLAVFERATTETSSAHTASGRTSYGQLANGSESFSELPKTCTRPLRRPPVRLPIENRWPFDVFAWDSYGLGEQ